MLGVGIIKGMVETARNFVGSYYDPARLPTIEYPDVRQALPESSRSFPMLIFDGEDPMAGLRCVACKICEKECPPQCIYIEQARDQRGKPLKHPKVFDLDISVCMSCQICVEVCPFDSIKMDSAFEVAVDDRFGGLLLDKHRLARSNEYYRSIHPAEAEQVDLRLEAGREKASPPPPKVAAATPSRMAA
ncbi:MAG: 4Fe-4S dicluster domain-containing protein [Verrucomicrobiales bacterium]|nr:4Fe-4S dicluster domain-containing protein [Verrucomicrobiales bacterium]